MINGRHKGSEPGQQIRKLEQNKKASKFMSLLICNNLMAGYVSQNWNTVLPSLILMYEKLEQFSCYSVPVASARNVGQK